MLSVTYSLAGTMSHELDSNIDHMHRVFDLIVSTGIPSRVALVLQLQDSAETALIK